MDDQKVALKYFDDYWSKKGDFAVDVWLKDSENNKLNETLVEFLAYDIYENKYCHYFIKKLPEPLI